MAIFSCPFIIFIPLKKSILLALYFYASQDKYLYSNLLHIYIINIIKELKELVNTLEGLKMVTDEKLVYTVPEVSELLGISSIHGYLMAKRGELPVIRLGRRIVVPKAALEKLLANAGEKAGS